MALSQNQQNNIADWYEETAKKFRDGTFKAAYMAMASEIKEVPPDSQTKKYEATGVHSFLLVYSEDPNHEEYVDRLGHKCGDAVAIFFR